MAAIHLENIHKTMQDNGIFKTILSGVRKKTVLKTRNTAQKAAFSIKNLNLHIPDGKIMVVLGPSGCGKTTLIRMIAGLIAPDSGEILYDGINLKDVPKEKRCVGMVFQNYALYPHFTVKENIISYYFFKKKNPVITQIAEEKLRKTSKLMDVPIDYLLDRKPNHLSGGEKQRVAVGRCITRNPILFLLDEPFSNLDQILRQKYRTHLKTLLHDFHITTVYVTHDQQEALILADIIAVMRDGRIEQCDTYEAIYNTPVNLFTAEFINHNLAVPAINLLEGETVAPQYRGKSAGIRPEDISLSPVKKEGWLEGEVVSSRIIPFNNDNVVEIIIRNRPLVACLPAEKTRDITNGTVWVNFVQFHLFDKSSGKRLDTVKGLSGK